MLRPKELYTWPRGDLIAHSTSAFLPKCLSSWLAQCTDALKIRAPRWSVRSRLHAVHQLDAQSRKSQSSGTCQDPVYKYLQKKILQAHQGQSNSEQISGQILGFVVLSVLSMRLSQHSLPPQGLVGSGHPNGHPNGHPSRVVTWEGSVRPDNHSVLWVRSVQPCLEAGVA